MMIERPRNVKWKGRRGEEIMRSWRRKKETAIATFQWDTNYTELEGS